MEKSLHSNSAALFLLKSYGKDSLSYFNLHHKKKFFFSSTGRSFLAYTIKLRVAVVSSDPVGDENDIYLLLREFKIFLKGAGLTSCFIGTSERFYKKAQRLGYKRVHIGREAFLDLSQFNKLKLKKKLRRAERHIVNKGIICRIYSRKNLPEKFLSQLIEINQEWLKNRRQSTRGYSMTLGRIPDQADGDCTIVLSLYQDRVLGYLTFVPAYSSNCLSLDASRRRIASPNGLTEFMLLQSLTEFKQKGIVKVSLNFAAFKKIEKDENKEFFSKIIDSFYTFLYRAYRIESLYSFNNKFLPQWMNRYFLFENHLLMPLYMLACAQAELG